MKAKLILIAVLLGMFFSSCLDKAKDGKNNEKVKVEKSVVASSEVVTQTIVDKGGNKIDLSFDNAKNIVTVKYKGEVVKLKGQKPASGIWYKNDNYELRGKGNDIQFKKEGKIIFEHEDEIVFVEAKSKKGDVLNLTFNNTQGTLKAYLNGGEQIDLKREKSASGIWYKNDTYELIGKEDKYRLAKMGKVVFQNWE